jgi:hypothetical protein
MRTLRGRILTDLGSITPCVSRLPFHSSLTGGLVDTRRLDADYWYRNLSETARFDLAEAVPEDGAGLDSVRAPELGQRHHEGEHGRLRDVGAIERQAGRGVRGAPQYAFDGPVEVRGERIGAGAHALAEHRGGVPQFRPHARPLSPLAGEDEDH